MSGLGLSAAEAQAIKSNWAVVEGDLKQHGMNLFTELFEANPDVRKKFYRIEGPVKDMSKKPQLAAHANFFMNEFGTYVKGMDNTDEWHCAVKTNARKHYGGRRDVSVAQYNVVFDLLHNYLNKNLGSAFTTEASNGWKKFGKAFTNAIAAEYAVIAKE